ncbi:hypothetical protein PHYSODRAFT_260815, partial [Phytophthora sojae]
MQIFVGEANSRDSNSAAATTRKAAGIYTVYNSLWGEEDNDPTGGQCTAVTGSTSSSVLWHTSYNWAGDNWQVKSSLRSSRSTIMKYSYAYDGNIIANVAYGMFTSMVWLAALGGAWPL